MSFRHSLIELLSIAAGKAKRLLPALLLAVLVAGCQSSGLDEGLKKDAAGSENPLPDKTYGSGPVKIALLAPLTGGMAPAGADVRDGAALALKELDQGNITMTVLDTGSSADRAALASQEAITLGTSFMAIYGDAPAIAASTTGGVAGLGLVDNATARPAGMFAFLPGPVDSLAAGIAHAAANVEGEAVIFVPDDFTDRDRNMLDERLNGRVKYTVVAYTAKDQPIKIAGAAANAAIVGFAGTDSRVSEIVRGLLISRGKDNLPAIVGNSGWPQSLYQFPELNGAIVALPDISGYQRIATAYKNEYDRDLTSDAAYGYDTVAIVAGLVGAKGPEGLMRDNFLAKAGFRGVTGSFRFMADGSVQRLFAIFVNNAGKMTRIADPGQGF